MLSVEQKHCSCETLRSVSKTVKNYSTTACIYDQKKGNTYSRDDGAIFWVVNASSCEKICLVFDTDLVRVRRKGGEVFHIVLREW